MKPSVPRVFVVESRPGTSILPTAAQRRGVVTVSGPRVAFFGTHAKPKRVGGDMYDQVLLNFRSVLKSGVPANHGLHAMSATEIETIRS